MRYVQERLLSRPRLEQVARETDLDLRADSPADFDNLITQLSKDIKLAPLARPGGRRERFEQNLYAVRYRDENPVVARSVVQTLVNAFQEDALQTSQSDQAEARQFLDEQIAVYEGRLQEAEKKRADFNRQWINYLPGEAGNYFQRLQTEKAAIQEVGTELRIAEDRRRTLASRLEESRAVVRANPDEEYTSPAAEVEAQIADLEFRLNALLIDYTEKHPDVISTREKLANLRERLAGMDPDDPGAGGGTAIVVDNLQMALNETDVLISGLRSRLAQHREREQELQSTVDTVIGVEAEYAKLNRDYEAIQAQFNELVQRRERLTLGEEVRETSNVQFEIIEPPRVAPEPVAPNRPRLLFTVLAAALGAGAGLAFLFSQFNPVFDSRETLFEETGLPVLGAVSMAWKPAQITKRRVSIAGITAGAVVLVAVFGVVFATQQQMTRLLQSLVG